MGQLSSLLKKIFETKNHVAFSHFFPFFSLHSPTRPIFQDFLNFQIRRLKFSDYKSQVGAPGF